MTAPAHVLLVDDREESLEYLSALLRGNGFLVRCARRGDEALASATANPPLVVISDLLMPVMDGYTLLRHWKSEPVLLKIPFIVYTATYTEPEDERLALRLGADAFILKPSEPESFLEQLHRVLAATPADSQNPRLDDGSEILRQHNEALIRKLEHKSRKLDELNQALRHEITVRSESDQTQAAILNALPAHIALVDAQGVIQSVNAAWQRFAAYNSLTAAEFGVGQNYLSVCDESVSGVSDDAMRVGAAIREVLGGQRSSFSLEYPCHSPTREHWFKVMVTPSHHHEKPMAVVMHLDITERIAAERRLRDSQAQYLMILNSTAEGIYGLDLDGVCTFCNPAAAKLLGFNNADELVGLFVHQEHHHSHSDGRPLRFEECVPHNALLLGDGTHSEDEIFFRKDGSSFPVEYWSHPIRDGAATVGAVVAFLDISERRDLEARFMQSQKMEAVGRLAGGVAHDFNNALQVINICAELLEERLADDETDLNFAREIHSAGRRGADLTHKLLAFSRKQLLRPSALDLNAVVRGIEEMIRRLIGEDIELLVDYGTNIGTIEAEAGLIEQVLLNLAINARDAMPYGGKLWINTSKVDSVAEQLKQPPDRQRGAHVLLAVRDSGSGMDAETKTRIFEPFFTTKEVGKGTGLGLSMVYGIIEQSGGFIDIDSTPGIGTQFQIYLPVVDRNPENALATQSVNRAPCGTETVLLVEDEGPLRTLIANTLRAYGYHVLEAMNGQSAMDFVRAGGTPIDLLLSDVILPDIGGTELYERLRLFHPCLKVLYMTGYSGDYISRRGVLEPGTSLLEKPFSIESLLSKTRDAIDASDPQIRSRGDS